MATFIGTYDGISHTLTNVSKITLRDNDVAVVSRAFLTPFLHWLSCAFFTTRYCWFFIIYFHNEPSVKSTSVSFSMLIFTGCYVHILYVVYLTLNREYYTVDLCMVLVWLSGSGLSMPLIFATILVKMLSQRVYISHFHCMLSKLKKTVHSYQIVLSFSVLSLFFRPTS